MVAAQMQIKSVETDFGNCGVIVVLDSLPFAPMQKMEAVVVEMSQKSASI